MRYVFSGHTPRKNKECQFGYFWCCALRFMAAANAVIFDFFMFFASEKRTIAVCREKVVFLFSPKILQKFDKYLPDQKTPVGSAVPKYIAAD